MTYNKKSIGPVISFILWALGVLTVCIVGISNVFAATYDSTTFTAQLYDNYGPSLHSVTTDFTNMSWRGTIPGMTANTSGAAWGVSSPIPLIANHTYSMTVKIEGTYGGNIVLSTYNRIGVGTSLENAKTSYENNTNSTLNYSNAISSNMTLQFAFTPSISSNYIVFPFATDYTGNNQSFYLYNIIIEDLGSGGVNQTEINNSLNNQTNEINNSITNSENNIKDSIKETEDNIKDSIKDGFENCRDSYNLFDSDDWYNTLHNINSNDILKVTIDGNEYYQFRPNSIWTVQYMKGQFKENTQYLFSAKARKFDNITQTSTGIVFVYTDGTSTSAFVNNILEEYNYYLTSAPNKTIDYIRLNYAFNNYVLMRDIQLVEGTTVKSYEKFGEKVCKNRIDDTNDKLDDVNKSLNDDSIDSSSANSFFDSFSSTDHGGISGIITAPLVAIKKMLDKNCSPLSATYKGKKIELPCGYDFWSKMTAIKEFINLTLGGLLCYNIIRKLFKLIESMKNPDDDRVEVMKL